MKKLRLLILSALLVYGFCNGQSVAPSVGAGQIQNNLNYDAIVDTAKLWSVAIEYMNIRYSSYCKIGDTITIGDHVYHKVYETNDSLQSTWYFSGYIRENESGEVYFRNNSGVEGLIYSFNLSANDSVIVYNALVCPEFDTLIVSATDSVWLGDRYRKRIFIYNSVLDEIWTEGIGSTFGLLYSNVCYVGCVYNLICYYESDTLIYQNPDYESCYYHLPPSINDNEPSESFRINYNATDRTITINCSDTEKTGLTYHLSIFNLMGNEIYHGKLMNNNQIISASHFATGIYLVNIISSGNLIFRSKILIY